MNRWIFIGFIAAFFWFFGNVHTQAFFNGATNCKLPGEISGFPLCQLDSAGNPIIVNPPPKSPPSPTSTLAPLGLKVKTICQNNQPVNVLLWDHSTKNTIFEAFRADYNPGTKKYTEGPRINNQEIGPGKPGLTFDPTNKYLTYVDRNGGTVKFRVDAFNANKTMKISSNTVAVTTPSCPLTKAFVKQGVYTSPVITASDVSKFATFAPLLTGGTLPAKTSVMYEFASAKDNYKTFSQAFVHTGTNFSIDLQNATTLKKAPQLKDTKLIKVRITLGTTDDKATPKLKGFRVVYQPVATPTTTVASATPAPCPSNDITRPVVAITPGSFVDYTFTKRVYTVGEPVDFKIVNEGFDDAILADSPPGQAFKVLKDGVVVGPQASLTSRTAVPMTLKSGQNLQVSWDQKDSNGKQVVPGEYAIEALMKTGFAVRAIFPITASFATCAPTPVSASPSVSVTSSVSPSASPSASASATPAGTATANPTPSVTTTASATPSASATPASTTLKVTSQACTVQIQGANIGGPVNIPPPTPTTSTLDLAWDKVSDATTYQILYGTGDVAAGSLSTLTNVNQPTNNTPPSYPDPNAVKGTKYTYQIKALKGEQVLATSNLVVVTNCN